MSADSEFRLQKDLESLLLELDLDPEVIAPILKDLGVKNLKV
jgi:hypothetical protein